MKPYDLPDARGHFGQYGGIFVAETLMHALAELRDAYEHYRKDPEFVAEFERELKHFVGRPSPVYHARRWSERIALWIASSTEAASCNRSRCKSSRSRWRCFDIGHSSFVIRHWSLVTGR